MKIKYKLYLLALFALVSVLVIGGIGVVVSMRGDDSMDKAFSLHDNAAHIFTLDTTTSDLMRFTYRISSISNLPPEKQVERLRLVAQDLDEAIRNAEEHFDFLSKTRFNRPENAETWREIAALWGTWHSVDRDIATRLKNALTNPSPEQLREMYAFAIQRNIDRQESSRQMDKLMGKMTGLAGETVQELAVSSKADTKNLELVLGATVAVIVAVLGWLMFSLDRSVIKTIERVRDMVIAIGHNHDLTLRSGYQAKDEVGEMTVAFDYMVSELQTSLNSIRDRMREVTEAAVSLASGAQQVADSSTQQSQATSAMAAAVEETTVSINTVSSSAHEAQNVAKSAGESADQGGAIIEQTVQEMGRIAQTVASASTVIEALGEDSQQISTVVQVIKDVADQTNLLALNAAIEAARAGEQGRGFAVVADEVRKLAERTTQSTADISNMVAKIQHSSREAVAEMSEVVKQVESGQSLVAEAGARMQGIRDGAGQAVASISEISNALKEQNAASQDIARNVESVAQMTDQNSAAASSTADSARRMHELADEVRDIVAQFKV